MIRSSGEILARITFADSTEWIDVGGTVSTRGTPFTNPTATSLSVPAGGAGDSLFAADVLIDLPFPQIQASGGSEDEAVEMAEFSMMCINTSYLRDAAILNRIGLIILRMDAAKDPYQGDTTTGEMLTQVEASNADFVGNASSARGNHDLALTASTQVSGGLADVGAVGTGNGFSSNGSDTNGDFAVVGRHELGHNWGSNHFEGGGTPEGNTIMSGNSLGKFSSGELSRILAHRQTRLAFLDDLGDTAPPLPPRAASDVIVTEVASPPVNVSPLANDSDTNGGLLSITSFDAVSRSGFLVTEDEDELTISVPTDFSLTTDRISYSISDETNKTSDADIFIKTYMDGETLGHWTFDQETTLALDSSSYVNTAQLQGDASIEDQVLHLDGSGDRATALLNRSVTSNTITYSAMIYRNGDQTDFSGLIFQNDADTLGFNIGTNNELRYHWDNIDHWGYNSGLVVPDQTWTFVALVIEPTQATFYMDDGTNGLQTITRSSTHPLKTHNSYSIGSFPNSSSRYFNGMMDEARLINRALSSDEIELLSQEALGTRNPSPANGSKIARDSVRLKWTPSPLSQSQRLYLGSQYQAVRDATTGDPTDQGNITTTQYDLTTLAPGNYYWRVDNVENTGLSVTGSIWTFEVRADGLIAHYPLDQIQGEPANTTPCLCGSDHDGAVLGTPAVVEGVLGNALEFNTSTATNSRLTLPASTFTDLADEVTIAFWAKGHSPSFPRRNYVFEGLTAGGRLVLSANLPWLDSKVYWEAGNSSGFDSIDLLAPADLTFDHWTHWAFIKDANTGRMAIYANGALFHSEEGNTQLLNSAIANFSIAGRVNAADKWAGAIDDFRIYNTALDGSSIQQLYQAGIPYYQWAASHYTSLDLLEEEISSPASNNNLFLYSVQGDPAAPLSADLPSVNDKTFSFTRIKGGTETTSYTVDDISYQIETSTDLTTGSWSTDTSLWEEQEAATEDTATDTERITIRPTDPNTDSFFYRLRLDHQPE